MPDHQEKDFPEKMTVVWKGGWTVEKTIQMIFKNSAGKNFSISLDTPKDDLTGADVKPAMDLIVSKNIFATTGGDVTQLSTANIISRDVVELELL